MRIAMVLALVLGLAGLAAAQARPAIPSAAEVSQLEAEVAARVAEQRYAEAAAAQARIIVIFRRELSAIPGWEGGALSYLAQLHLAQGRHDLAADALVAAVPLFQAQYGNNSPYVLTALDGARNGLMNAGRMEEAWPFEERALAVVGRTQPEEALDVRLGQSAELWSRVSLERALQLKKRQVDLRVKTSGSAAIPVVAALTEAGQLAQALARWDEAELYFRRAAAAVREQKAATRFDRAVVVNNLAELLRARGDALRALPLYEQAMVALGPGAGADGDEQKAVLDVKATLLNNRGLAKKAMGELGAAEEDLRGALGARRALGDDVGASYPENNLGDLLREIGRRDEARVLLEHAVNTRLESLGAGSDETATATLNLALLEAEEGRFLLAERGYQRARTAYAALYGDEHPRTANALANAAWSRFRRGDAVGALPDLELAEGRLAATVPPDHPYLRAARQNLATLLWQTGSAARAEAIFVESERLLLERLGEEHLEHLLAAANLGEIERARGKKRRGEARVRRALAQLEAQLGSQHPWIAHLRLNVAGHHLEAKRYAAARPLLEQSLFAYAQLPSPPLEAVLASMHLTDVCMALRDHDAGVRQLQSTLDLAERYLRSVLVVGTDDERMAALAPIHELLEIVAPLALAFDDQPALTRALITAVLRWKGRALEVSDVRMREVRLALGREAAGDLRALQTARAEAARLALGMVKESPDEEKARLATLRAARARAAEAEAEVFRRLGNVVAAAAEVEVEDVVGSLPPRGLLIEWLKVRGEKGRARYFVFALTPEGVLWRDDLGDARAVEAAVARFRQAAAKRRDDVEAASLDLTRRILGDLYDGEGAAILAAAEHLVLSPDDAISLVPFAALRGQDATWLVEEKTLSVIGSGRELLRLQQPPTPPRGPPLVVASPDFGAAGQTLLQQFQALPGTLSEGVTVRRLLGQADLLVGVRATEAAVKEREGPAVLHLATHGFFLSAEAEVKKRSDPRAPASSGGAARGFKIVTPGGSAGPHAPPPSVPGAVVPGPLTPEPGVLALGVAARELDPLARSGLALAHANVRETLAGEDGILTAMEAASLDLDGTELVVLSACKTGVGETRAGGGVIGLRRALSLAGARSHVMSLWSVDDEATRALMIAYYRRLARGEGRAEALRKAQLDVMKAGGPFAHPFSWAAFIVSGDYRPLPSSLR